MRHLETFENAPRHANPRGGQESERFQGFLPLTPARRSLPSASSDPRSRVAVHGVDRSRSDVRAPYTRPQLASFSIARPFAAHTREFAKIDREVYSVTPEGSILEPALLEPAQLESWTWASPVPLTCTECGAVLPTPPPTDPGRPRVMCSDRCRKRRARAARKSGQ